MNRRTFLNLGVTMGGTVVLAGVSYFGCSGTNTVGRGIPTKDQAVLTSKEANMARYMRIWINLGTGRVEIVDDESGNPGKPLTIEEMQERLRGFADNEALPILSTHSSPGCKYVRHGDGSYREVCE